MSEKVSFSLYGQVVKVENDTKFIKIYGEQKVLPVKVKDDIKVGDSVLLTLYEGENFHLLKVKLVNHKKVPVFLKHFTKTSTGIEAILVSKDETISITRYIDKSDPLFISLKTQRMIIAAVFDDKVFLETA